MASPIDIFVSYAPADVELCASLEKHLAALKRAGEIHTWNAQQISAGEDWREVIRVRLGAAQVILLLLSADFFASDQCFDVEVEKALEQASSGQSRVIPIRVRPYDWGAVPFERLRALPTNGVPVSTWPDPDEAWAEIACSIRLAIKGSAPVEASAQLATQPSPPIQSAFASNSCTVILYHPKDHRVVVPLVELLRSAGQEVFVDVKDLSYGIGRREQILDAIRKASRVIVFWSESYQQSQESMEQCHAALSAPGCRVVPVPLDDFTLPQELSAIHAPTGLAVLFKDLKNTKKYRNWVVVGWTVVATLFAGMTALTLTPAHGPDLLGAAFIGAILLGYGLVSSLPLFAVPLLYLGWRRRSIYRKALRTLAVSEGIGNEVKLDT